MTPLHEAVSANYVDLVAAILDYVARHPARFPPVRELLTGAKNGEGASVREVAATAEMAALLDAASTAEMGAKAARPPKVPDFAGSVASGPLSLLLLPSLLAKSVSLFSLHFLKEDMRK